MISAVVYAVHKYMGDPLQLAVLLNAWLKIANSEGLVAGSPHARIHEAIEAYSKVKKAKSAENRLALMRRILHGIDAIMKNSSKIAKLEPKAKWDRFDDANIIKEITTWDENRRKYRGK